MVTTKYPWAPLLADLQLPNNGIIPKDYAGKSKDEFYEAPIGTGPFMWGTWQKGSALKLKKNPSYWQAGKPSLDSGHLEGRPGRQLPRDPAPGRPGAHQRGSAVLQPQQLKSRRA